jgi:hypothetical protein
MPDNKKIQKRRTVSFNPDVFEILVEHAAKEKKSVSHWVIDTLRAAGVPLPETPHMEYEATQKAIRTRAANRARANEPNDTAPQ